MRILALLVAVALVTGCSVAKLEARLEANPQCKDVVNPKTGATMPCPNTEKLMGSQTTVMGSPVIATPAMGGKQTSDSAVMPIAAPAVTRLPLAQPCKPQMNAKTGTVMPCPNG
jgi:hypothetical protein